MTLLKVNLLPDAKQLDCDQSNVALLEKGDDLTAEEWAQVLAWIEAMSEEQLNQVLEKVHDVHPLFAGDVVVREVPVRHHKSAPHDDDQELMFEDLVGRGRAVPVSLPHRRVVYPAVTR
jgi:hypothetical protein